MPFSPIKGIHSMLVFFRQQKSTPDLLQTSPCFSLRSMQGMAPEEQVLNNTTEESRVAHGRLAPRCGEKAAGVICPIGSVYAIYANIYHQYTPNVSIYTIHGSYGCFYERFLLRFVKGILFWHVTMFHRNSPLDEMGIGLISADMGVTINMI